jgi:hypothetical protein
MGCLIAVSKSQFVWEAQFGQASDWDTGFQTKFIRTYRFTGKTVHAIDFISTCVSSSGRIAASENLFDRCTVCTCTRRCDIIIWRYSTHPTQSEIASSCRPQPVSSRRLPEDKF